MKVVFVMAIVFCLGVTAWGVGEEERNYYSRSQQYKMFYCSPMSQRRHDDRRVYPRFPWAPPQRPVAPRATERVDAQPQEEPMAAETSRPAVPGPVCDNPAEDQAIQGTSSTPENQPQTSQGSSKKSKKTKEAKNTKRESIERKAKTAAKQQLGLAFLFLCLWLFTSL